MIEYVTIGRSAACGRYADVIQVAEYLKDTYGSPTNAMAVMVRDSKIFKAAWARMCRNGKAPNENKEAAAE